MEHCQLAHVESGSGKAKALLPNAGREFQMTSKTPSIRKSLLALAVMALAVSACNTVKGVGQDIESVGEAGDRAIR
jgi:entericidin B